MIAAQRAGRKNGRPLLGARWFESHFLALTLLLFTRVTGVLHFPNLLHDLLQVVAGRALQRRERDVALKFLQP